MANRVVALLLSGLLVASGVPSVALAEAAGELGFEGGATQTDSPGEVAAPLLVSGQPEEPVQVPDVVQEPAAREPAAQEPAAQEPPAQAPALEVQAEDEPADLAAETLSVQATSVPQA